MRVLLAALLLVSAGSAGATTFTVTKTADTADGTCNADCSLREAVEAANTSEGADEIVLPAGTFQLTRNETDGQPYGGLGIDDHSGPALDSLTVRGAGMAQTIIEQTIAPTFGSVFGVEDDLEQFVIQDLTLKGGYEDNGACLNVRTPAAIERVRFTECRATENGGALMTFQPVVIRESVFDHNFASGYGGAAETRDLATISDTTFSDNDALGDGGGLVADDELALERVTFSGNRAGGNGGGLLNWWTATATNVTFSGNQAGHVFPASADVGPSAVLAGTGGAVWAYAPIRLVHATLTANGAAGGGGGVFNAVRPENGPDPVGTAPTALELQATIVAANTPEDCLDDPFGTTVTPKVSLGYVLDADGSCITGATGDLTAADPGLAALADNGGPVEPATKTHALEPGSPAIDAAGDTCAVGVDQRGGVRPEDGDGNGSELCDIGAFEFGAEAPTTTTTTTTTLPGGTTTTSTTLPGCADDPSFASFHCRLGELIDATQASDDLGKQKAKLTNTATAARELTNRAREKCAAGDEKAANKSGRDLKKAGKKLSGYRRGFTSNKARKTIDDSVRQSFLGLVEPLIGDLKSFRGSLVCPDAASAEVALQPAR